MPDFVVFDIETTGLYANGTDRIIEIATVVLDEQLKVVERWETLVNPGRDVGPSHVHGISAADVATAPTFDDLAGDIWHRFHGCVPVSHNFAFDSAFICAEYARSGFALENFEGVCTLRQMSSIEIGARHRLLDCCRFFGIEIDAPHSAGDDAYACALLWSRIVNDFGFLACPGILSHEELWRKPATPLGITRRSAQRRRQHSYISELMTKMPDCPYKSDSNCHSGDAYIALLEEALEDRCVDEVEASQLHELALSHGLISSQIDDIHTRFLKSLAALAVSDQSISSAEQRDYLRVAQLLGIPDERALAYLTESSHESVQSWRENLSGKTVCFTGASQCFLNGDRIDEKKQTELVLANGLIIAKSVTKKLDILVVADPDTMSGKAKKARGYGTRIIAERAFWPKLGISGD